MRRERRSTIKKYPILSEEEQAEKQTKALIHAFQSSKFSILGSDHGRSNPKHADAFFRDSSRRARVSLQLQIEFPHQESWNLVASSGILQHLASDVFEKEDKAALEELVQATTTSTAPAVAASSSPSSSAPLLLSSSSEMESSLRFECACKQHDSERDEKMLGSTASSVVSNLSNKSANNSDKSNLIVEGVTIVSCKLLHNKKNNSSNSNSNSNSSSSSSNDALTTTTPPPSPKRKNSTSSTHSQTKTPERKKRSDSTSQSHTNTPERKKKSSSSKYGFLFRVEVIVRASPSEKQKTQINEKIKQGFSALMEEESDNDASVDVEGGGGFVDGNIDHHKILEMLYLPIYADLSVQAVFSMREVQPKINSRIPVSPRTAAPEFIGDLSLGLLALEAGNTVIDYHSHTNTSSASFSNVVVETKRIRSQPQFISLKAMNPITLTVREVGGARAATGATLVSLTVAHSNVHDHPVTINNLALHPGHSREAKSSSPLYITPTSTSTCNSNGTASNNNNTHSHSHFHYYPTLTIYNTSVDPPIVTFNKSMQGGEADIIDMSRHVRWGYAPGTAPTLPITLNKHEAFSTVIKIDASDNLVSRTLITPIAVVAEIGKDRSLASTDARYTTSRVAEELSDAFRIDMSLREARYRVGAPLVVSLRVLNLSNEDRDLMLLMAKDEDKNQQRTNTNPSYFRKDSQMHLMMGMGEPQQPKQFSVNTAVVSEVNGYTFGVWGLAGDDDGTTRHNRDHELLAVDAALLLGEVKAQHSIEAELRFVPLREGTLDVPNLKLYDKLSEKWYSCVHMLKIVASAS